MKIFFRFILLIIVAGVSGQCSNSTPKRSIEDLKTAFNIESTAAEKYTKFAQVAMEEGFDTITRLFEAVSKSESIHAFNHGKALEKLGGNAEVAVIGSYEVKSTAENIQTAINSETYELQTMYPGFVRNSEKEKAPDAAKSFTWAWDTEKKHLSYFRQAAESMLKGNETALQITWYVCPLCGNTYNPTDIKEICDFCLTRQENFIGYSENPE